MSFKRFKPGDPPVIPARQANAWTDAARDLIARRMNRGGEPIENTRQDNIVLVKNTSEVDRDRFDILGIDGPIFSRSENQSTFQSRIALKGATPTAASHTGKFVILAEPIRAGSIGRAWISGAAICKVAINDEADTAADVAGGDASKLASGSGAATLLWVEPIGERETAGVAWCVVRFGGSGDGSSSGSSTTFLAHLTHVLQCETVAGLPEYHWVEAELNGCVSQAKSGGRTSEPTYTVFDFALVGSSVGVGQVDPDAPQLVFPEAGSTLPGTVTPGSPDTIVIEFEWTAENGGGADTYFLGVGDAPHEVYPTSAWDIYQEENTDLGDVQTKEVSGVPVDERTIAVRVWNATKWNDYTFKIVRSGGGLAVGTEDLNVLARGDTVPEPAEYGGAGWIPATKTAMATAIRAIITRSVDADGNQRYVFVRGGGTGESEIDCETTEETTHVAEFDTESCEVTEGQITWVKIGECEGESVWGRLGPIVDPDA